MRLAGRFAIETAELVAEVRQLAGAQRDAMPRAVGAGLARDQLDLSGQPVGVAARGHRRIRVAVDAQHQLAALRAKGHLEGHHAADEARRALLGEGRQALARVVGREQDREQVGLVHEVRTEVAVQRAVRRLLRVGQRDRALGGDLLRDLERARQQLLRLEDGVHEAALERLVGLDHAPGQHELLGEAERRRAREALRAAPARDDAEVDLGLPEARGRGGEAQVAGERHLAAAAQRVAVDGGDRRLAHRLEQVREVLAVLGVLARHQRRLGRQLGDVRARDEGAIARAREHRDAALVVVGETAEGRQQLLEQLARERVQDLGPVDRHDRDAAVHADVDRHQPVAACACR